MPYRISTRLAVAYLVTIILTACVILVAGKATMAHAFTSPSAAPATVTVNVHRSCPVEDDPTWNWATCGNGVRGIVDMWGNRRVVGACEFVYRVRHHMIDRRGDRMLGDRSARRVCGGAFPQSFREAVARDNGQES